MPRIVMERSGEMEIFARVVREGGFSAAARSLDLTPSAVSKLVARLERRLGVRLLHRTTRALTMTDEGASYYRSAAAALAALEEAEDLSSGGLRGRLRISATVPYGTMYVLPAVISFRARHPDLTVELSLADGIVDLVTERCDVAVRMGDLPDSGLHARRLSASRRVVCASPAYLDLHGVPGTPSDLAGHECLTFSFRRDHPTWPFRRADEDASCEVSGGLILADGETIKVRRSPEPALPAWEGSTSSAS